MKMVRTRPGHAPWRAVAFLTAAVLVSFQALAFPIVTNVVETGGDNEATDTIVAQWTGVTWNTTVANEPTLNTPVGTAFTVPSFGEDVPAMVDRAHQWNGATAALPIPNYLLGGEYLMIGNDNRDNASFRLDLYLAERAAVFLLLDWRAGDVAQGGAAASNSDPPYLGAAANDWVAMTWVHAGGFQPVTSGWNRFANADWPDEIGYDEVGTAGVGPGQEIQQYAAVYYKAVDPGAEGTPAVSLYEPNLSGLNMYGVVVTPAPPVPAGLTTISLNGRVAVSWSAASFATSYNIKRSDTPGGPYTSVGTSPTTSFTDPGLVNFQNYYYVVAAVGLAGESSDSAEVMGTPKSAPADLVAQGGTNQIALSWTALADAASYTLKRADVSGGPYTDLATGVTETSHVDDELPAGRRFYYTVSAVYTGGGDSANSDEAFALTAPNVPASFVAQRFAATVIRLTWTVGDQLPATTTTLIEESSDGTTFSELTTLTDGGQRYYDVGLAPSITNYYRARATNSSGSSDFTAVASATTPASGINVNFADTAVTNAVDYPIPGYLDDFGLVFGDRENGYNYGWDADNSANDRLRNAANSPDRRYDTLNHVQKTPGARSWEIEVPNGLYLVHIVGGDATATDTVFQWDVEGYVSKTLSAAAGENWKEFNLTVPVADGRLTITNGPSASNNKICFVDIYPTEPSANEFVTQPASQTVDENRSVAFSVAVSGPEPYTLQWRFNGNPIENATNATYSIARAQLSDAGAYSVAVNNPGNVPAVSSDAMLTVVDLPNLWDIVSTSENFSELETAILAAGLETALQGEDFLTVFAPDNAAFAALPAGALDALLADTNLLTAVLGYHVLPGIRTAADLVAGDYATLNGANVTVTTPEGAVKVNDATVTAADVFAANGVAHVIDQVLLPPVVIVTQPEATVAAYIGDTVTLSVEAFGVAPITYQWTKGGVDIEGATSATLTLADAQESDSGAYAVKVTNPVGTVTSNDSVVTISPIPEPPVITTQPQATVAAYVGETVTLSVVATGEGTITYQWTKGGADIDGATSASLVLANAQESDSGTYAVKVSNRGGTVTSDDSVVTVSVKPPTLWEIVSTNPDLSTLKTAVETAGLTSVLQGTDPLTVFAPNNAAFEALPAGVLDALLANPEQLAGILTYHALGGTQLSANLVPGDYPTLLDGALVTVSTNATAILINNATVITADVIALNGAAHVIDQVLLPQAPVVTKQPFASVVATVGDSVTLSVVATGTGPLSYQWTLGGVNLEGATAATLVLNSLQLTNAGTYAVRISNPVDSVTSSDSVVSIYEVVSGRPQIMWVSFHPGENTPSANAAAAGFAQAPDVGYTALLKANGYPVTRVLTSGAPDTNLLNTADLVIISRSVPSGDYQDPPETAAWNGITAPTLMVNGYILRNTRLGFTTGGTMVDTTNTVTLKVNDPAHPVFAGIQLDANGTMLNPYANRMSFNGALQSGISVNKDPLAGGGTVLATIGTELDPTFGGTMVAEWQAGAVVGSGRDTLAGHRLVLLTGSRESGITSEGAGIFDLTADGTQLFLNAVKYMTRAEIAAPVIADGKITITWTGAGVLETATDINGPWTPVATTGGTFTEDVGTGNKFYRVNNTP